VKPWILIGETAAPDGTPLTLKSRDGEYLLLADGKPLMTSEMHASEDALATLTCRRLTKHAAPHVLIGGLGMGFTLRAALDLLPPTATVVVAELVPEVVTWNKGPLGPLAGHPLDDPRVKVEEIDVAIALRLHPGRFAAVLLDVDNSSDALVAAGNAWLYGDRGIETLRTALTRDGILGVWAAYEDRRFARRLRQHGFTVDIERVRGRLKRGPRHAVLLAYQSVAR
jgi:spermidine synthase